MSELDSSKNINTSKKRINSDIEDSKNNFIDIMACSIAHDLNNLLTAVSINLNFLESSKKPSSESNKYIKDASSATEVAMRMTRRLFSLSGCCKGTKEKININELLRSSANIISSSEEGKFNISIDDDVEFIYADISQMEQLFHNLLLNAVEATVDKTGESILDISAENKVINYFQAKSMCGFKAGEYILFKIKDNGAGISSDLKEKIFELNFTTKKEGTGLGLYTCKWVVENHDGCIDVESEKGVGTTFNVYLPRSVEAA